MTVTPVETKAQALFAALNVDIAIPALDLDGPEFEIPELEAPLGEESRPKLIDITTGDIDGAGAFEKYMVAYRAHLELEYSAGRISGDQLTKAYMELMPSAMGMAMQFVLTKDQVYWQSVTAQMNFQRARIETVQARIQAETAKMQLLASRRQAELLEAQYVQVLIGIAQGHATYELTHRQITLAEEQYEAARGQTKGTLADGITPIAGLVGKQLEMVDEQIGLVREQVEQARAQTLDTRTDTTPVTGYIGKQKLLLTEQVESYKKDAVYKAVKIYSDSWIAQKTIDEGLLAPTQMTNTEINEVLSQMRTGVGLTP